MSTVNVNLNGRCFFASANNGETLLSALRRAGFTLPAACGGKGKCGKCRVTVNGVSRLACKVIPNEGDEVLLSTASGGRILTETIEVKEQPTGKQGIVAAIDLGTTTVAVRIYDLFSGAELGTLSEWNSQGAYGGDVISRISHTMECENGLAELSERIRSQCEKMIMELLSDCGKPVEELKEIVLVGNTVMQHIFAAMPVESIAAAPFKPHSLFREKLSDTLLGAKINYAPCVSGYVGGDITAGILAADLPNKDGNFLFLDIGTNGEMALGGKAGFSCCAVASGPAFEGAGISCGMAGVDGAISHVSYKNGFLYDIIGAAQPKGICGSGLIDLIAILLDLGCIDEGGRLLPPSEAPEQMRRFLEEDEDGNGIFRLTKTVYLTARDVRNLQLAKAAVAAGIDVLLKNRGLCKGELDGVYLAGGFGNYIRLKNAVKIGMLPEIEEQKLHAVGNTALAGASMMALNDTKKEQVLKISDSMEYTELSGRADFTAAFTGNMIF